MAATQVLTKEAHKVTGPAVCLKDMTVGYDKTPILENTSLEVPWGQIIGVIGPNGAGKSTLIKTILGTLRAFSGTVEIGGYPARSKEARDLIGYVPQREVVNWDFPVTVSDVVMMGRTARLGWLRFPGLPDRSTVNDSLKQVDMGGFSNRQISQLSGGQQQRVFLARALAQGGRLLLLDEPLNGVDASTQETICSLLRRVRDEGGTVIMATHDLELAASWCDRLIMVNHAVVGYGTPAEALRPEILRLTYGGQVLVVPDLDNGTNGHARTVVPDVHGNPGGQPEPGTHPKILR
jgi:ABC-type Mn2+/Zn2+ transport system ATPase subunit